MKLKTNKKIIVMLVMVTLLFGLVAINVVKAATPLTSAVTVTSTTGKVGDEVTVTIKTTEQCVVTNTDLLLKFDKTKLQYVSYNEDNAILVRGLSVEMNNRVGHSDPRYIDGFKIAMASSSELTIQANTIIAEIKFKILDGASGPQTLTLINGDFEEDPVITTATVDVKVPATKVTLDKANLNLTVGDKEKLEATVTPANTTDTVKWESSNSEVLSVDQSGNIEALKVGEATVTVTVGDQKAECKVSITKPLVSVSIKREKEETFLKGQTTKLIAVLNPEDTYPAPKAEDYTWSVDNTDVVKLEKTTGENIEVTGLKEGNATVTLTVGGKTANYTITVKEIPLDSVVINKEDFNLLYGKTEQLSIVPNPANTTDSYNVTWQTSDEKVVTVDENGKVTAVGVGEATITAIVKKADGTVVTGPEGKTVQVKITVPEVTLEKVIIKANKTQLEVEEKTTLAFETSPEGVTTPIESVKWESSDESILKVSDTGEVIALKPGKATIKLTVNGEYTSEVEITVTEKVAEEPQGGNVQGNAESVAPQTGDIAIETFAILMIVSLVGIVLVIVKKNKNAK